MSTKTTFKRIALVAVAALGLGVLSVAPSSAAPSSVVVTVVNGSAEKTTGNNAETASATTIAVSGYAASVGDSLTVSVIQDSKPTAASFGGFRLGLSDTGTSVVSVVANGAALGTPLTALANGAKKVAAYDSVTVSSSGSGFYGVSTGTDVGAITANFILSVDTTTATREDGTYGFTVVVKSYELGALKSTATYPASFVINKSASQSTTVAPASSTAIMSKGATWAATTTDSSVALVSTASATDQAVIRVVTVNAAGSAAAESITATVTGAGVIGFNGTYGKSITVAGSGSTDLLVRADGTAGTGSIVIKTTSVTFPAKTVTFYAKAASTITVAVNKPVIGTAGDTDVIRATATDANGNVWGGTAYIYAASAADALIAGSETPAACTFNAAKAYHECPVTGTTKGTANFKVIDASTVALMTATSASAAVRVSTAVAASVKISFDKASYAPGEKALVLVTVLDADGLALPAQTITGVFAAAPTVSTAFSGTAPTFTTSATLAAATSSSSGTVAGSEAFVAYMPYYAGDITITATGSTGLAAAGRVAVTATATVANASVDAATDAANEATDAANAATDAALAAADAADAATAAAQDASDAVAALSATVAKLVASLKAQITSLTNLVIKIQKKVKA
jgi:hypothetical protein